MRDEIDPQLPYIQVHRSVAAMAAQLAPALSLTYQHVRGALDVFWESLADRRILGRALQLPTPMVLLTSAEAANRLWLAFGVKVDLELAESAGILDLTGDGKYRVRGMSRYLDAEGARLKRKGGTTPVAPGSDPGRTPVEPVPHPAKARGERREARGEREETKGDVGAAASEADRFWGWAQDLRVKAGCVREAPPEPRTLSGWYSAAMMELNGADARLREAWLRFGDDPHWQQATPACPFRAFMNAETGWRKYVPRLRAS